MNKYRKYLQAYIDDMPLSVGRIDEVDESSGEQTRSILFFLSKS
jgi:hypothetical protein